MPAQDRKAHLCPLDCDAILNGRELTGLLENGVPICVGAAGEFLQPVARQTAAHHRRKPREAPWISYLVVDAHSGQIVGVCAFTDAPKDGEVEIAYYTFPPYEGRGYASSAASAITAMALNFPLVQTVIAHTLMESNASTRVLAKCGFVRTGVATDPDEGAVWRWERRGRISDSISTNTQTTASP